MKKLCIDLYCGLGGWTEGFLAEGYECIGFDIERHDYGPEVSKNEDGSIHVRPGGYPGHLVLQDVLTLHGSQFREATVIVASPPCQAYSYRAMPWKRAKALPPPDNSLFEACFRIQREACEAAGRYIPLVVENVRGAQPWVGRAKANFGSYYLWGDVESIGGRIVRSGPVEFGMPSVAAERGQKQPGRNFHFPEKYGIPSPSFHGADHEPSVMAALGLRNDGVKCGGSAGDDWFTHHNRPEFNSRAQKNNGGSWFAQAHNTESGHSRNPVTGEDGAKQHGSGSKWFDKALDQRRREATAQKCAGDWFNGYHPGQGQANNFSSRSSSRKAASAQIAKIPFPLAQYIARTFSTASKAGAA